MITSTEAIEAMLKKHNKVSIAVSGDIYVKGEPVGAGSVLTFGTKDRADLAKVLSTGSQFVDILDEPATHKVAAPQVPQRRSDQVAREELLTGALIEALTKALGQPAPAMETKAKEQKDSKAA